MSYTLDNLYANCDELVNAKDKTNEVCHVGKKICGLIVLNIILLLQHPDKFQFIIDAAKNGKDASVKKLASQLIGRFCKHFPALHFQAFEAVFDLCEDDDVNVSNIDQTYFNLCLII